MNPMVCGALAYCLLIKALPGMKEDRFHAPAAVVIAVRVIAGIMGLLHAPGLAERIRIRLGSFQRP